MTHKAKWIYPNIFGRSLFFWHCFCMHSDSLSFSLSLFLSIYSQTHEIFSSLIKMNLYFNVLRLLRKVLFSPCFDLTLDRYKRSLILICALICVFLWNTLIARIADCWVRLAKNLSLRRFFLCLFLFFFVSLAFLNDNSTALQQKMKTLQVFSVLTNELIEI